jgi:hypothetical protein
MISHTTPKEMTTTRTTRKIRLLLRRRVKRKLLTQMSRVSRRQQMPRLPILEEVVKGDPFLVKGVLLSPKRQDI